MRKEPWLHFFTSIDLLRLNVVRVGGLKSLITLDMYLLSWTRTLFLILLFYLVTDFIIFLLLRSAIGLLLIWDLALSGTCIQVVLNGVCYFLQDRFLSWCWRSFLIDLIVLNLFFIFLILDTILDWGLAIIASFSSFFVISLILIANYRLSCTPNYFGIIRRHV